MVRAAVPPNQASFFDNDDQDQDVKPVRIDDVFDQEVTGEPQVLDAVSQETPTAADGSEPEEDLQLIETVPQETVSVAEAQETADVPVKRRSRRERRQRIADVLEKALAPSTIDTYGKQYQKFEIWCQENGEQPLPADPETVADYLIEKAEDDGWRKATIKIAWAGIADKHRTNGFEEIANHAGIRRTVRSLAKNDKRPQVQAKPLRAEQMERIRGAAWVPRITGGRRPRKETPAETRKRALLDIAICSVGRDGLLRRSELAELRWGDVRFRDDGTGIIHLCFSKTDQEAEGRDRLIGEDCVADLKAIMPDDALVNPQRRVIGLSDSQIGRRIRRICLEAGLGDGYTGHSGRVGMAKDLRADGAELPELMDAGDWKSPETVARYTMEEDAARGAVGKYYAKRRHKRKGGDPD